MAPAYHFVPAAFHRRISALSLHGQKGVPVPACPAPFVESARVGSAALRSHRWREAMAGAPGNHCTSRYIISTKQSDTTGPNPLRTVRIEATIILYTLTQLYVHRFGLLLCVFLPFLST